MKNHQGDEGEPLSNHLVSQDEDLQKQVVDCPLDPILSSLMFGGSRLLVEMLDTSFRKPPASPHQVLMNEGINELRRGA